MTSVNSILNSTVGIQELLRMPPEAGLPQAKELAAGMLQQTGLESLFATHGARTATEALICPSVGDGTLVSPEVFSGLLESLVKKLRKSPNDKVRTMAEKELMPLMQNNMLLSAYRGLMLGG